MSVRYRLGGVRFEHVTRPVIFEQDHLDVAARLHTSYCCLKFANGHCPVLIRHARSKITGKKKAPGATAQGTSELDSLVVRVRRNSAYFSIETAGGAFQGGIPRSNRERAKEKAGLGREARGFGSLVSLALDS
jgi:hypothetical protein